METLVLSRYADLLTANSSTNTRQTMVGELVHNPKHERELPSAVTSQTVRQSELIEQPEHSPLCPSVSYPVQAATPD
jgi:hypothetical protein